MLDLTTNSCTSAALIESAKAHEQIAVQAFASVPEVGLCNGVGPKNALGVYGLFRFGSLMYVGKVSPPLGRSNRRPAKFGRKPKKPTTINSRLAAHRRKIAKRVNISVDEMTCKWIEIDPMDAQYIESLEATLIYALKPPWNDSGFGKCGHGYVENGERTGYLSAWDEEFPEHQSVVCSLADLLS